MQSNSKLKIDRMKVCPKCKYDAIAPGTTLCPLCQTKIVDKREQEKTVYTPQRIIKNSSSSTKKRSSSRGANQIELILKSQRKNWLNFVRKNPQIGSNLINQLNQVKKPLNLTGLAVVGLGLVLWINLLLTRTKVEVVEVKSPPPKTEAAKSPVPEGIFNYGGDSIFAPIVASGINSAMESVYPEFGLRYTKPLNDDFSSVNGIKMLLDGELSFAYNARALKTEEYMEANLRSIELKYVPIAIDGVVFYSNIAIPSVNLNRSQIRQIFSGEITNWNQIDPQIEDLPLVPVVVEDENLALLGLEERAELVETTQYADNYTQAMRETIGTPGAISFASASLVENQKLIKAFSLADGSSSNYVRPQVETFKDATYPITRRIQIVYRADGTVDQKAAKAYINFLTSPKGQEIIETARLVPIH